MRLPPSTFTSTPHNPKSKLRTAIKYNHYSYYQTFCAHPQLLMCICFQTRLSHLLWSLLSRRRRLASLALALSYFTNTNPIHFIIADPEGLLSLGQSPNPRREETAGDTVCPGILLLLIRRHEAATGGL